MTYGDLFKLFKSQHKALASCVSDYRPTSKANEIQVWLQNDATLKVLWIEETGKFEITKLPQPKEPSNIRIINLKDYSLFEDEVLIRVDRNTIMGSPYYLNNKADPVERETIITQYRQYFRYAMEYGVNIYYGQPEVAAAMQRYVEQIVKTARHTRVALGCWCYPEPCHADVIKEYVEEQLP